MADPAVMRLKVANTSTYVHVPWSPYQDTAWGLTLADDDVLVTLYDGKRGSVLAAKLSTVPAMTDGDAAWVLRRDLATEMFDGVPDIALRRVRVIHDGKTLHSDHVYVDVLGDRML